MSTFFEYVHTRSLRILSGFRHICVLAHLHVNWARMWMFLWWSYSSWSCTHVRCYVRTSSSADVNVLWIFSHPQSTELHWVLTHEVMKVIIIIIIMILIINIIITIIITRSAYRLDWCYVVFLPNMCTAITVFSRQFRWCAICASGNGAGPMPTTIWFMHLAQPSHEPEHANGKKAAQKMQPSWHFAKTARKCVTDFRAVFLIPQKSKLLKIIISPQ